MTEIKRFHQLDVILLAETWLKNSTENRVKIPGYNLVCSHRKHKGGGVGILLAAKLQYRERPDLTLNIPDFESITVEIKTHNESIFTCADPPTQMRKNSIKTIRDYLKSSVEAN